ncbi:MAG: hypothetical protein J5972_07575 [Eubacterium sp.]|nr:hypothetical protein [Eubacterium sp.]
MLADIRLKHKMFFLPIIIMTAYLLLFVYFFTPNPGQEEQFRKNCLVQLHAWLPLMSFWWLSIFLNNYCIRGFNELLMIYSTNKRFVFQKIVSIFTYEIYVLFIFLVVNQRLNFGMLTLLQLMLETLTIGAIFNIIFFIIRNVSAATLFVIVYSIFLNFFDTFKYLDFLSIYPAIDSDMENSMGKIYMCGMIILVSIPFWILPIKTKRGGGLIEKYFSCR